MRLDLVGLLGARAARLAIGLATMFVYARMFGISTTYDAWIWSLGVVNAVGLMLFGPISETIRASYSAVEHRDGRLAAEQYMATVAVIMVGAAVAVQLFLVLAMPVLTSTLSGEHGEQASASQFFLTVMGPSLIVAQLVTVLTASLNCRGKVFLPEVAGIGGGLAGIGFILCFHSLPAVWLLSVSYYLTLLAPLVVAGPAWMELARGVRRLHRGAFMRYGREALMFSLPLLLPYALGQVSGLVERQLALQAGMGLLAILSYAFYARNTVQAVFTAALSALAIPALARAADDAVAFGQAVEHWSRQSLLIVTVGMIWLFGLAEFAPIILFGRNLAPDGSALLVTLLKLYAVSLLFVVAYLVGGVMLLAARRGRTYALIGSAAGLGSTLILVGLFPWAGLPAIPIALAISHGAAAWFMFRSFDRLAVAPVICRALLGAVAVIAGGGLVARLGDTAHGAGAGLYVRLILCTVAAATMSALWWIVEHKAGHWERNRANEAQH